MKFKKELHAACLAFINKKIALLSELISDLHVAANNETKSSAGDKFETGRAMMQLEIEKNALQLREWQLQYAELERIDPLRSCLKAEAGALLKCNSGNYYIAVACGKMIMENEIYYAISVEAPIAKILLGKKRGDSFDFNGKKFQINEVY